MTSFHTSNAHAEVTTAAPIGHGPSGCRLRPLIGLSRRRFAGVIALLLSLVGASAALAQLVPCSPAAKTFNLGEFKVSILRDARLEFPNDGKIFALNARPDDVTNALRDAGAATDKIALDIDAMLVQMPGHVVLLDTGYGVPGKSVLPQSLALAGVAPDAVTDVLITHAHHDHVGGLLNAEGHLAFAKATIWISTRDWAFMQTEPDLQTEIPVIKPQVKTFEPGASVVPGITSIDLAGHTPGQCGYEIVSHGQRLADIGDLAHSSVVSLADPNWTLAWDSDKNKAVEARRHELQHLADVHERLFAPHFPFPGVGYVKRAHQGFQFKPDLPAGR